MEGKISLISLGCAKNLVDSEQMLRRLEDAGFTPADEPEGADAAVINTCAFIESAKMEAIENILYLAQLKKEGKLKKIVVAGCLAQRYAEELPDELPEVDAFVGTGSFGDIVEAVTAVLSGEKGRAYMGDISAPLAEYGREVSTGPGWAYLKIAEGCSNACAYCVIPSIRGKYRSRPMEDVLEEAKKLAADGVKELIVIAQDITMYGVDLYKKRRLAELIEELCKTDGIEWIRLHYLYPDAMDDELIDVIARQEKVLKYLDIPIQHIDNTILKMMRRRGTGDEIRTLFAKLRERIPGVVLRTSVIAGLPGEGEEEFEELAGFLRQAKIERAGVFVYSPEEGTPAALMDRPDTETAEERAEALENVQAEIMAGFNASRVGKLEKVLCEGFDEDTSLWIGRSFAESPDVDGVILFSAENAEPGRFYSVRLRGELDGDMVGEAEF